VLFFFALSCLAAATFGSVVLYQKGERRRLEAGGGADPRLLLGAKTDSKPPSKAPSRAVEDGGDPTLETLQRGDIVDDGENDWVVQGSLRYREERESWALHGLMGGGRPRFLEVRRRGGALEVALVEVAHGLPGGQLLQGLTYAGQSFQLEVRGDARVAVDGEVVVGDRSLQPGVIAYARYSGPGGAVLLVEDEGASRRAWLGERVPASSLSLMSGELNRADS
jgi:hypothetical protein